MLRTQARHLRSSYDWITSRAGWIVEGIVDVRNALVAVLALFALASCSTLNGEPASSSNAALLQTDVRLDRPNIVVIMFEDLSPRIGAFGDPVATTPVLDAFASTAVRYPNAFTTSGVCAPSRSSFITGMHQQTLGTQHMRTNSPVPQLKGGGPIEYEAVPPADVKAFPELLRAAGYYTTNDGKTDYQFGNPFTVWDRNGPDANWRGRADGQPFFAMFNPQETHESYIWPEDRQSANPLVRLVTERNRNELAAKQRVTDPADVVVPPYLPDTPVVRADIARHYDNISFAEKRVAEILAMLEEDGLLETTIVIVTSDHGDGLPRMKRTVYDSGLRVPFMIRFPGKRDGGQADTRLVSFVDLAPTVLRWAGYAPQSWHQGVALQKNEARRYVYAAADRFDQLPGRTRAVFDGRWKYIRNYRPELAVLRPLPFRDVLPTMQEIWRLAEAGALDGPARGLIEPRGAEELYDLQSDPDEIVNLAVTGQAMAELVRLRTALDDWLGRAGDLGAMEELRMIEAMWPGLEQPDTADPVIRYEAGMVTLRSPTEGASIAYTLGGGDPTDGQVYSKPFAVPPGATVSARAVRYGYKPSAIVRSVAE